MTLCDRGCGCLSIHEGSFGIFGLGIVGCGRLTLDFYLQGYRKSPSSIKTECATIVIAS